MMLLKKHGGAKSVDKILATKGTETKLSIITGIMDQVIVNAGTFEYTHTKKAGILSKQL